MKTWSVIDWGVNGQPFLWKKRAGKHFVMIDIFGPNTSRRCYRVLAYAKNPYSDENQKGKVIGIGCAPRRKDWNSAYQRARKIAEHYMNTN